MKHFILIVLAVTLTSCASGQDRHNLYYQSLKDIAKERAQERQDELRIKVELIKALFTGVQESTILPTMNQQIIVRNDNTALKVMAMMMILNDREDPYALSRALREVGTPAPTVGERVTDGIFRTLPVALGIAGAAYGGYLIKKAGEYGAATAVANAPTTVNNTTTNENYNVNSYNSQEASIGQSNSGGAGGLGGGGGHNSDSGNMGNAAAIGQGMDFQANNPAMRSTGYQAPFNEPLGVTIP